ncbi:NCR1, Niemann-pick type C [Piedraia hortae CBS 480.64]|uniref:NCR1, Niemann-pick type C n=1 Tax=Piedraia hortae CBS 480.64 TaxID=1314780 RepID=A0A6A7BU57_9PEZI|nr:NCR1, Niemann-pick type C [Piedraia hortae CBS 480.64]
MKRWLVLLLALAFEASAVAMTRLHEPGRCAIRGQCGSQSLFGAQLPCPDNGAAETPSSKLRDSIVEVCGSEWANTKVCCTDEQVDALKSNLDKAKNIISACPACHKNFYDLFCTFTCSPDQSLFVNITATVEKGGKHLVTELDQLVSANYGRGFYDSCKDVKFGATGGKAMDFIGGSAKNYSQFLKFLGDKRPFLGSPFQINFPTDPQLFPGMEPVLADPKACNSSDERYRCACVDCEPSCPALPDVASDHDCHVGLLPCLSFAVIIIYVVFITLLVLAVGGHVAASKRRRNKNERMQLLRDSTTMDDEDELANESMLGPGAAEVLEWQRPTKTYWLNGICSRAFSQLARTCAQFPAITIVSSVVIVGLLSLGWLRFAVEMDPVKLWVAPNSNAAKEKAFFDDNFGPFFRAEQAFLVNDTLPSGPGPVLSYDVLEWWFGVEQRIAWLKSKDSGYTLDDVCYKPTGDSCVLQSLTQYFGGSFSQLEPKHWAEQIQECADTPVTCLPDSGQPLPIEQLLGRHNTFSGHVREAEALIATWVVNNFNPGDKRLQMAEEWEESLKTLLMDVQYEARERGLRLSFNTEISLEQELNKNTNTDARIVVISYLVMFVYASLALGSTTMTASMIMHRPVQALVQSKFSLGVVGILIVLMSVAASVGLFASLGVKATLIIAEVIPFLILAVGVDNIFLIVHEFERVNISHADETVADRAARALGRMGPSILLSAITETVSIALGAAVGMPAVKNFAAYAAGAVLINAILQMTMFVAVLALNQQRVEDGRMDCVPCFRVKESQDSDMPNGFGGAPFSGVEEEGWLRRFVRTRYAPFVLGSKMRVLIVTVFLGFFAAGIALLPDVPLGLDQRVAIPTDSYLIDYFNDLSDYFDAGPPVYFVVKNANATKRYVQQELCGRFSTCNKFSLANVLEQERKRPEISYISQSTASWIDDCLQWLNPMLEHCCVERDGSVCFADRDPPWNVSLYGMPEGQEFVTYMEKWLKSPTNEECSLGGQAPYSDAVVVDKKALTIPASHFRTAHTPLRTQDDFIQAYASARRIAQDISERNDIEVFPYSKFYIFFDQYASIVRLSTILVGASLGFIFVITSLFLGSLATGLVVTLTVLMIVTDIVGTMALVGVSLNAVSLVNIVICVGIAVEFCAHIARAFTMPLLSVLERTPSSLPLSPGSDGQVARSWAALVTVGGSVFSGITVTKFLGVFVLAFTRSKIFEIYYFRIWVSLVLWAATHALIFLPVALSLFGGRGYIDPESDGGLEQDLANRRYHALIPEEDYESDG